MEQNAPLLVQLLPLFVIAFWAIMLYDWYKHCANRRDLWLIIIVLGGIIGYVFFYFSRDRQQ